jgi:hypothetical protein
MELMKRSGRKPEDSIVTDESSYYVVLSKITDLDPDRLAAILCSELKMLRYDAISYLRNHWGMLSRTEDEVKARGLHHKFKEVGIDTFVLPSSELRDVSAARVLKKAVPESGGLSFEEDGQNIVIPWGSFIMICAGMVEGSETVTEVLAPDGKVGKWVARTGISPITAVAITAERAKKREKVKEKTTQDYYLDLVAKESGDNVRIVGNNFDYSYLGERKGYNVLMNFKSLVMDIAGFLPGAVRNRGLHAIVTEAVMTNFKYNNINEYENEKLWLAQLTPNS